jgi:beta-lactamase superfamily II metal-dependent hydrolase
VEILAEVKIIDEDILRVYKFGKPRKKENLLATFFWGDKIRVVEKVGKYWKLVFTKRIWNDEKRKYEWIKSDGAIPIKTRFRETPLLKIRFIDVGQGDAAIIESPKGKMVLIDGGEGEHLRNYVSTVWARTLRYKSLDIEAVVITHGDADHFGGMTKLLKAKRGYNRPLLQVKRVYHNGIIKAPSKTKESERLGPTKKKNDRLHIVNLVNDPSNSPDTNLNKYFKSWKKALNEHKKNTPDLKIERLEYGSNQAFDFLSDENIFVQTLGPLVTEVEGDPALPFLYNEKNSISAGQTINGHSIVLKLKYGNIRVLFGADLNAESEISLLERVKKDKISLASEILKVPHHGSADFDPKMLEAVRPVVSIISSGDESASREYIHPRAGLVGALGRYSNPSVEKPLIYVTEMVAFFERVGTARIQKTKPRVEKPFERTNVYVKKIFGIVHIRTDGKRVLVASHGGKPDQKESYAFNVDEQGQLSFENKTNIV